MGTPDGPDPNDGARKAQSNRKITTGTPKVIASICGRGRLVVLAVPVPAVEVDMSFLPIWNTMFHLTKWSILFHLLFCQGRLTTMRKDASDNRQAIIQAAKTLISREGIKVSMRAIAREAQVGVATVTRHYPEKTDIFTAIVYDALEQVRALIDTQLAQFPAAPVDTWQTTIHGLINLRLPAITQEVIPELAKIFTEEDMNHSASELEDVYRPFLKAAAEHGLCSPHLQPFTFHLGIIMLSRPLPRPADERFGAELNDIVEIFIAGLRRWDADEV